MWRLCLLPVLISTLLMSAHFYRAGLNVLAMLCLALPFLLFYRKPIAVRIIQSCLLIAAAEWVRSMLEFIQIYQDNGLAWSRLAIILGSVAVFTAGSVFVFQAPVLRRHYGIVKG